MYDVAIIGAGVTGAMTARLLAKYQIKICVIEKTNDAANGATKANSAIIHAGFDAAEGSLKAMLNVKGSEMMEQIAKELGVKYKKNGSLVIGFNEEDLKEIQSLFERGLKNKVKDIAILNRGGLERLEPNLTSKALYALYAHTGAIICPYELTIAALGNAMDNGTEFIRNFEVISIKENRGCYEITNGKEKIKAKYIVNAAGLYADKIAKMAGDNSFNIHPRRGEYVLFDKECGDLISHTIFRTPTKKGKGILVTPTVDGNILAGPTSVDILDKEDKSTTSHGLAKILSEVKQNIENFPLNKNITSFCGLRAAGDTGDFIINSYKKTFINAAGIESPGLSASPAIAEMIRDLLSDGGLELKEKAYFNPYRKSMSYFRDASVEEKNRIIKKNKDYGKIICRCEKITLGEITDAINTNPKPFDLDGIKRRTRSLMGRCQGGFCSPYIVDILAKELNIPYEEITKSGGASKINTVKLKEGNGIG